MTEDIPDRVRDIPLATTVTKDRLNDKQLADYCHTRKHFVKWLFTFGKDITTAEGYSETTARSYADKHDQFCRWVWDEENRYTMSLTHDHADSYMQHIAFSDLAPSSRPSYYKSVRVYFDFLSHQRGMEEWEPEMTFSHRADISKPKDHFTTDERQKLREAALEYGSVPSYHSVTPDERHKWTLHLAQRFEKPMNEVGKDDWDRANGWKYASLIWTALDTALRPIEVERSKVSWIDLDRQVLVIPREASKNDERWESALTAKTVMALDKWLRERECYELYDGRDEIWLTKYGNPYDKDSLSNVVRRVCDVADIDTTNRDVSWYSIRRGTITAMCEAGDIAAAQQQARHKDPRSTMRYDQPSTERRRDVLENL